MGVDRRKFIAILAGSATLLGKVEAQNTSQNVSNTENASTNDTNITDGNVTDGNQDREPVTHVVEMGSSGGAYFFDPVGLFVRPGDTVRWEIVEPPHSTTAYHPDNPQADVQLIPDGADPWDSGTLNSEGASFEYTFEVEGTYSYYCIPHKTLGMVGRIVCGEPGGPGEQNEIPDPLPGEAQGQGTVPSSQAIVEKQQISYPYTQQQNGDGNGGTNGGQVVSPAVPGFVKTFGWGAIIVLLLSSLGAYVSKRYGGKPTSAKIGATIAGVLGLGLLLAVLFMLLLG